MMRVIFAMDLKAVNRLVYREHWNQSPISVTEGKFGHDQKSFVLGTTYHIEIIVHYDIMISLLHQLFGHLAVTKTELLYPLARFLLTKSTKRIHRLTYKNFSHSKDIFPPNYPHPVYLFIELHKASVYFSIRLQDSSPSNTHTFVNTLTKFL